NDDVEKAIGHVQYILQQQAANLDAHLMLSAIRLTQKRYQLLLDETEPLLKLAKLPEQLLFNRAVAFEHFKRYEQLGATLNQILAANPNHAEALNFLGYSYAVQNLQLDQAELLIKRALTLKPDDGYYLDSLAWVYFKKGDYAKAIELQSKALKQIPHDTVMHEHYGDMLWKVGKQDEARAAWQKSIDLKSAQPELLRKKITSGLETKP
ncbi:MAG: tetratricopeptide repeat protein, partial [Mariprofundus sp.]